MITGEDDFTHQEYMSICIPLLALCDTIYMQKDYKDSKGALMELEYAKKYNYKIIFESEE
ncbi:MAG: DUF4406 domain-containing protein [Anaerovoracaceae bacterium]